MYSFISKACHFVLKNIPILVVFHKNGKLLQISWSISKIHLICFHLKDSRSLQSNTNIDNFFKKSFLKEIIRLVLTIYEKNGIRSVQCLDFCTQESWCVEIRDSCIKEVAITHKERIKITIKKKSTFNIKVINVGVPFIMTPCAICTILHYKHI